MKRILFVLVLITTASSAHAQYRYGPGPGWIPNTEDWGPQEQRRRLPPHIYDPYDRGPERFGPPPPRMDREEYERRSWCAMHPRECS